MSVNSVYTVRAKDKYVFCSWLRLLLKGKVVHVQAMETYLRPGFVQPREKHFRINCEYDYDLYPYRISSCVSQMTH